MSAYIDGGLKRGQIFESTPSPKLLPSTILPRDKIYSYYPGFSRRFAEDTIKKLIKIGCKSIFDPWNGSGTVSLSAAQLGLKCTSTDINPVMFLVAKSKLVTCRNAELALKEAEDRLCDIEIKPSNNWIIIDPLSNWFDEKSVLLIRSICQKLEIPHINDIISTHGNITSEKALVTITFFRTIRKLLISFNTSNPTWIKISRKNINKFSITYSKLLSTFKSINKEIINIVNQESLNILTIPKIKISESDKLPMRTNTFDSCLTSPPYCTRIDYVVASLPELAILESSFFDIKNLRHTMIGTTIVPNLEITASINWGKTCNEILKKVKLHKSKASHTYYYKTLVGYFKKLYDSIQEISRVLRKGGYCIIVTQGSHYKELVIDLPRIIIEMASSLGLDSFSSKMFVNSKSFSAIYSEKISYNKSFKLPEVVSWLIKN